MINMKNGQNGQEKISTIDFLLIKNGVTQKSNGIIVQEINTIKISMGSKIVQTIPVLVIY